MSVLGYPKDIHGNPRFPLKSLGIRRDPWVSMNIYGYSLISMDIHRYWKGLTACAADPGFVWFSLGRFGLISVGFSEHWGVLGLSRAQLGAQTWILEPTSEVIAAWGCFSDARGTHCEAKGCPRDPRERPTVSKRVIKGVPESTQRRDKSQKCKNCDALILNDPARVWLRLHPPASLGEAKAPKLWENLVLCKQAMWPYHNDEDIVRIKGFLDSHEIASNGVNWLRCIYIFFQIKNRRFIKLELYNE